MVNMENGWTLPGTSKNWQVTTVNVHCVDNLLILVPMNGWPRSLLGNVLITLQHGTCHISPTTYLPQPPKKSTNSEATGWVDHWNMTTPATQPATSQSRVPSYPSAISEVISSPWQILWHLRCVKWISDVSCLKSCAVGHLGQYCGP